ncbi:MAG: glycosyltransferase family 2 protein [Candidatus Latescibacterota bacterium]
MNLRDVSVIITCFNEASNIRRCLDGVTGFGEVIVVDSFSSDATVGIAGEYPVMLFRRPYLSAAKQKNWAIALANNDWVLVVDADEAVPRELRAEIEALPESGARDGYWIRRISEYLGKPIRRCGWQRDKVLRFFNKTRGRYNEREVHEEVVLQGGTGYFNSRLVHFPYSRIEQHFDKINEYSSRGARDYIDRGGKHPILNTLLHPPFRFIRMYLLQRGFMDGLHGFILCLLSSYSVFLKYAKAWEYRRRMISR